MMLRFLSHSKHDRVPSEPAANDAPVLTEIGQEEDTVRGLCDLYSPEPTSQSHTRDVADVLLEMQKITDDQYGRLRRELMGRPGMDAATWLLKENLAGIEDVLEAKARLSGLEFRRVSPDEVDAQAFQKLEVDFIKRSNIVPISLEEGTLVVATSEPANIFALEDVKRQTQMETRVVVCSPDDVTAICESFQTEDSPDYDLDDIINDMSDVEVVQDEQDESLSVHG